LVGYRNGTIVRYNSQSQLFSNFYKDELEAGIATVLFDGSTAWINTFNGLVAYDTLAKTKVRYSTKEGLSHNEANRYSALKTKKGMLMGALRGVNYFIPDNLKVQEQSSELVLLKLEKFDDVTNQVVSIRDRSELAQGSAIVLPAEKKELALDFALTHAVTPNENSYRYRLNNSEWIDLKKQSSIRFANLAAGTYDLEIEARNFSGDLIGAPLQRKIQSKNFFYKTGWFFLLLFVGILALVVWMYYQFMLRKNLQEQFSENLLLSQETERTRIAKELHDSVGQQLTLIKKKAQNENKAEISSLTNTALEEVRAISRGLFPATLKQLGLSESIEQLVYDLDEETELFFSSEITNIDTHFKENQTLHVYRFIQESLTNILKHSEATSVTLSVLVQQHTVDILIHDNGKGFNVSEKSKINSLGLKTLSERIRILQGTLSIESQPNDGTIIRAEIPISK
jgi:signal transduction histidine kinase